jgi:hypothetical protein
VREAGGEQVNSETDAASTWLAFQRSKESRGHSHPKFMRAQLTPATVLVDGSTRGSNDNAIDIERVRVTGCASIVTN